MNERRRHILALALPIIGGMISQNVLNLVDTAMVGTLGDEAIAAVGVGGFLNFLLTAVILGLGAGVQAMASRRVGEGRDTETAVPLNGGLIVALVVGIPLSILLVWASPWIFPAVHDDPAVVTIGVPYLQVRLVAMVAMASNYSFRGYWNAVEKSMLYMRTLIVMHVANIVLNWVLIFGNLGAPEMGAVGAGVASAISTFIGTGAYIALGMHHARGGGFLRRLPDWATVHTMVRLAVPAGIQQLFFAAGMTAFIKIVGLLGTEELAVSKVLIDLMLVGILPGLGFGLAAASLVGQALGRGDPNDAKQWGWDVVKMAMLVVGAIGLPAALAPDLLLSGFLHDPATRALGVMPLRLIGIFLVTDCVGMVLMNSLMGAGATKTAMLWSTSLQWLLFLPLAYLVGPVAGFGLVAVWAANVGYRQLQSLVFASLWARGSWQNLKV